ncbi:MAG: DUF1476 domain-containing protein [Alphaproteobacteria bacterium]|nr:DUF1476 domain-containing protein [Alphaproteobacteria bacterium]
MSQFKDRENAFEKKYAHEEELDFAVEARCSKLFGLWVAEQLGLSGAEADAYAMEVVESNLEEPGFEDVLRKVNADIDEKGLEIADEDLRMELDRALIEAKKQLSNT